MHEKSPILVAKKRDRVGSRYSARIREQGGLPAIVYGHKEEPVPVALEAHSALSHISKGEKVFRLQMDGDKGEPQTVLLKDLQFDFLGSKIVHADFARVSLTDRVTIKVPVHLIGEAVGLKTAGAILMHPTNEIEVECLVTEIPDYVEVRIDDLQVDDTITASAVKLPTDGMKLKSDPHSILAQIMVQAEQVTTTEQAAVEAGAAAQPEVLTAKKPEEGKAAAAGAKPAAGGEKKAAPKK
jgi:large subunit ribosomal protein L25